MKKVPTAPVFHPIWMKYVSESLMSGRDIDQAFITKGFSAVAAEIDFTTAVYGVGAYDAALAAHSSREAFERYRVLESEIYGRLDAADKLPQRERDKIWDEIFKAEHVPSFLKQIALKSLNQARFEALLHLHVPALLKALRTEQEALCTVYSDPSTSLVEKDAIPIRKEAINSIMSEAYGSLGFEVLNRKKGIDTYVKEVAAGYSIVIEPDAVAIERPYSPIQNKPISAYWPLISYDRWCRLGPTGKPDRNRDMLLVAGGYCIASRRINAYEDTRTLEVMIRADALWYELTIQPFESLIRDFCERQSYPPKPV